ncbi:nickel pincer cofactor biosynthesis protein LarC [Anaerophilus nitritogenes]|uniref:nickel pincer cofactor biosynthesis protein LarC n=1 Tax=Anaerophilus nitritogenes TaxID=2498136 RepID=UPI00101DCDC3|nr:nickel pincer cofactor biosynthesis protein LarC [Anaerophilus nitritogenes]
MEKILYFDCLSGISGDMSIAALLDLGIDQKDFLNELNKLNIEGYTIQIKKNQKNGITGTDFYVVLHNEHDHSHHDKHDHKHHHKDHTHAHDHEHRNLYDIEKIIDESSLNENVKNLSKKIFTHVANAEAKVHGKSIDQVHFHEVGAIDSIVDIVGVAICIDLLDIDHIYASPLHVGTGFVKCAHGTIPVPAPATLEILKDIPIYSQGIQSELVTPTGAAIIKSLAKDFIPLPSMAIENIGYGLGKKDLPISNLLRVYIGKKKSDESLLVLETNIDDMNPEIYSYLMPTLFEHGALDVYFTNIIMKKNRPAIKLTILCTKEKEAILENILFRETTTLGIRKYQVTRNTLSRKIIKFMSSFGDISLKVAYKDEKILKYSPEYEECKQIAQKYNIPLQKVYETILYDCNQVFL